MAPLSSYIHVIIIVIIRDETAERVECKNYKLPTEHPPNTQDSDKRIHKKPKLHASLPLAAMPELAFLFF